MRGIESPRARAAISGAILGALIAVAADALGFVGVLKLGGPSIVLPMLVLGAVVGVTRLRPALWIVTTLLAATLIIVSYTPVTRALTRPLIRRDSLTNARFDAIVILAGGINDDLLMNGSTLNRLLSGVALSRRHLVSGVIISREYARNRPGSSGDAADQRAILALAPVPAPIYFVDSASSTRDEALRTSAVVRVFGWSRIAVVTSPLHTRRACATFEAVGFSVTCVPSTERAFASEMLAGPGDRLPAFRGWVYELAAGLKYRWAGWIH